MVPHPSGRRAERAGGKDWYPLPDLEQCELCGQCVDVCPVGALTERTAKGVARSWELQRIRTTCAHCGMGCQTVVHLKDGEVVKVTGAGDVPPNRGRLCKRGRFAVLEPDERARLEEPLVRKDGQLVKASWDEALDLVAERLGAAAPGEVAGLIAPVCTNEEAYQAQKFFRAVLGTNDIDHRAAPTSGVSLASTGTGAGVCYTSGALTVLEEARAVLVVGDGEVADHPVAGTALRRAVRDGAHLMVLDAGHSDLGDAAAVRMTVAAAQSPRCSTASSPCCSPTSCTAAARPVTWCRTSASSRRCSPPSSRSASPRTPAWTRPPSAPSPPSSSTCGRPWCAPRSAPPTTWPAPAPPSSSCSRCSTTWPAPAASRCRSAPATSRAWSAWASPRTCCPAATRSRTPTPGSAWPTPGASPRCRQSPAAPPPRSSPALKDGAVKTAWVWANEAASFGDAADVLAAVEAADFVVVQGAVRGDLAELADVVLPSVAWGEEDGTFTNAERRISRLRRVQRPAGAARPGWWAFREVAKRLGHEWQSGYPKAVWEDEIALLIPSLAGVTWAEIAEYGLCWPAPAPVPA